MFRRLIVPLILLFSVWCTWAPGASADGQKQVEVAVDSLNVRSGPGLTYTVISNVTAKTSLTVLAEKDNWMQVQLPDGKTGWVAGWYVQPAPSQPDASPNGPTPSAGTDGPASARYVQSVATNLNVRSGPGQTYPVLTRINPGKTYLLLEKNGDWRKIQLSENQTGWVAGWFVEEVASPPGPSSPAAPVQPSTHIIHLTSLTNVYTAPAQMGVVMGQLSAGDKVEVLAQSDGWGKIIYDGAEGWISLPAANPAPGQTAPEPPQAPAAPGKKQVSVSVSALNLRSKPTTESDLLSTLAEGTILTVLDSEGDWYRVQTPHGQVGWVAGWFVSELTQSPLPSPPVATVLNANTSVRAEPDMQAGVVGQVQAGERYPILKKEGDWFLIRLSDSVTGYVPGWMVNVDGTDQFAAGDVLKGKVIVIDPGHGGEDNGATGTSFSTLEKTVNLQVAQMLRSKLEAAGAKVVMTRNDDRKLTLQSRVDIAVQSKADLFVSIHHNSHQDPATSGTIVFYYAEGPSSKLASLVQNEIVQMTHYKNLNARTGNYHVLRENPITSILVEVGFLSNREEELRLRSAAQQNLAAEGIYRGIVRYFQGNGTSQTQTIAQS